MIAGLTLTAGGLLLMYLAIVDIDLKDAATALLENVVIVRREPKPEIVGKDSNTLPKDVGT
jgi:hypothetical protein